MKYDQHQFGKQYVLVNTQHRHTHTFLVVTYDKNGIERMERKKKVHKTLNVKNITIIF